jgi:60 kDa SS-A/Ro ribonucleoprotein
MGKFNAAKQPKSTKTVNLAGGEAYAQSAELELVSILLTSFVQDQYYKSAASTMKTLSDLLNKVDPKFAAKAAIYARNEFGMRSITHVLAVEVAKYISGKEWGKKFFQEIVRRPDDMTEIIAFYFSKNKGKALPNALKKGFAKAFDKFDNYQLAKYKGDGKEVSLVDAVNLVHPKAIEKNAKALDELINGTLKSTETWEAKLTQAGQKAESEEEKLTLKADAWKELIESRKLGYFALLRNLRNILEQAPSLVDQACEMLTDEKLIKKSLVLPFRFSTAIQEIEKLSSSKEAKKIMVALNKAVDISCSNVTKFDGETLVVLDVSGSMAGRPAEIGALFSAILIKSNFADFMTFSDSASYRNVNPADGTLTIAKNMRFAAGGTNFHSIFKTANKAYDRIIILSDMQGWIGYNCPKADFEAYKRRFNCSPNIYSFDLAGHGTMQFPENKVFAIAGFSEKVFDVMSLLEQDKKALVNTIKNYVDLD